MLSIKAKHFFSDKKSLMYTVTWSHRQEINFTDQHISFSSQNIQLIKSQ